LKVKVIDFDLAQKVIPGQKSDVFAGSSSYLSPQIVLKEPYSLEKNQVWQLGCLLYILYFSNHPFQNNFEIVQKDLYNDFLYYSRESASISIPDANFIARMLAKEEINRPTMKEVSDIVHEWFIAF
jgi:serine/threonine protein kinase